MESLDYVPGFPAHVLMCSLGSLFVHHHWLSWRPLSICHFCVIPVSSVGDCLALRGTNSPQIESDPRARHSRAGLWPQSLPCFLSPLVLDMVLWAEENWSPASPVSSALLLIWPRTEGAEGGEGENGTCGPPSFRGEGELPGGGALKRSTGW